MKLSLAAARAVLWRSALFIGLWWALTDGRADSWGVGSVSILAAVSLSLRLLPPVSATVSRIGLLRFVVFFFDQSLRGGIQVAWFALRPRLSLRPAIHEIPLRLPEGIGRVLLTNTLSRLPGTLSVGLEGNRLRTKWGQTPFIPRFLGLPTPFDAARLCPNTNKMGSDTIYTIYTPLPRPPNPL